MKLDEALATLKVVKKIHGGIKQQPFYHTEPVNDLIERLCEKISYLDGYSQGLQKRCDGIEHVAKVIEKQF